MIKPSLVSGTGCSVTSQGSQACKQLHMQYVLMHEDSTFTRGYDYDRPSRNNLWELRFVSGFWEDRA